MNVLIPGKPLLAQLDVVNSAGVRVAAGSAPTIVIRRNDAIETGLTLTPSNPVTGLYLYYAAAVPAWSHGDQVILDADTGSTGAGAFASFTVIDPAIAGAQMTLTSAYDAAKTAAAPGAQMALTPGASSTLTAAVEAALLNDLDGQDLLAAIGAKVQTLFDSGVDVPVATLVNQIVAGVWANGSRTITGGSLTTAPPTAAQIAGAILLDASRKLLTDPDGKVTATNGGSVDVSAITASIAAIQASLAILAAAPSNTDPTATENRLNFVLNETSSRTIHLAYSYSGAVKVRWNTPRGVLIEEQSVNAAGTTISVSPPALATASPRVATWQVVRNDTKAELASGTYNVSVD